jgi:K+-sensing histidine kinase KdpD
MMMTNRQVLVGSLVRAAGAISSIALISLAVALDGGGQSPLVFLYALPVVFLAIAYHRLAAQVQGTAEARRESERRAELLATVARTARSVSALETDEVLQAVVRGVTTLGLESANLALFDEVDGTYRVAHGIGLPEEYVESAHPATAGMPGLVRARRETVVVDDYAGHPNAIPSLRDRGFRAAIATPVWAHGRLTAALVAGTRHRREVAPEETEAFELLAALAGRALENARAFEDERRTVERMSELDRLKGDFLSNVSHELRTPLTAISGMGLTLEQQWDGLDEEIRRELLARLNANARTLDRIIGNLLDYSRLEAGRMEIRMEPVRVDDLLEQVSGRLRTLFAAHPLSVEIERGLVVRADPLLLDREAGQVVVAVTDSGPGIPPEEQRHLGDRFFRGRDPTEQRTRGTGLGLALVREVLRLHGADLEIDSAPGRGARFAFRQPQAAEVSAASASGAASAT